MCNELGMAGYRISRYAWTSLASLHAARDEVLGLRKTANAVKETSL